MRLRRLALSALLLWAAAGNLAAQENRGAGPSFLIFRYASVSSMGMYSGYNAGPVLFVVGMLHNPRSQYREIMAAVGKSLPIGDGNSVMLATAAAYTNTGWYSQFYLIPSLRTGRLRVDATAQVAEPLSARGARAFYVSPGNAFFDLGGGFSAGLAYYGGMEQGAAPSHGSGPALQRAVPHGSITLELVKGIANASDEVRLTLRSSF